MYLTPSRSEQLVQYGAVQILCPSRRDPTEEPFACDVDDALRDQGLTAPATSGHMAPQIYHWNPSRPPRRLRGIARGPLRSILSRPVNNFGDLLGPIVVRGLLHRANIEIPPGTDGRKLLSVGSVLHEASDGDIVWGAGVHGAKPDEAYGFRTLDVRAVRGPATRDFLANRGLEVPDVYGDPALLLPMVMPELSEWAQTPRHEVTVVSHLHDLDLIKRSPDVLDPTRGLTYCLRRIAQSKSVVASSLHALIVAESLGIPAKGFRASTQPDFKYRDYYVATGRPDYSLADSAEEALEMGPEAPLRWDAEPLLKAFPYDVF